MYSRNFTQYNKRIQSYYRIVVFFYSVSLYVLPYGQMSLWGATVITNLMSAIPWIGQDIVESKKLQI